MKIRIAVLVRKDYWITPSGPGNQATHRSVPDIMAALRRAGGSPELVYPDSPEGHFHGFVLPGGGDVHPAFYGQRIGPGVDAVSLDPSLDRFQLGWARRILAWGRPVLGICRGMQVLNVAAGGSLVQDIPGHCPAAVLADPRLRPEPVHTLRLDPDSGLARGLGSAPRAVNSIHHQCVDRLGQGLKAVAWAEDSVVEAVEHVQRSWQRGVQFHPEDMTGFQGLFDQLVSDAARATSGCFPD